MYFLPLIITVVVGTMIVSTTAADMYLSNIYY